MDAVLRGGVADANNIPPALLKEMYLVGNRPEHYRGFLSLLRNAESWDTATKDYGRIQMPILLIWGDQDWARPVEREHDRMLIAGVEMTTLAGRRAFSSARPASRADRGNYPLRRAQPYSSLEAVSAVATGCGLEMI
jgi:pimeloyl-ACP methyl ester carboxylesterase